ncbi:MAG: hypothetical protein OXI05_12950 [Bacteroidota bacterium]|nr:hypothetical protein [Bacteroidota bacterium]
MNIATVGVDGGNTYEGVGLVVNFDIDHNGTVYYINLMDIKVHIYSYDGKFIGNYEINRNY